jgi:hypothetical protein
MSIDRLRVPIKATSPYSALPMDPLILYSLSLTFYQTLLSAEKHRLWTIWSNVSLKQIDRHLQALIQDGARSCRLAD